MAAIPCLLLLSLLIATMPLPGSCEDSAGGLLIQCYDPAADDNGTAAFRASLLRLLGALPSAAAPTGFASLRSSAGAFARGLCFGDSAAPPTECRRCLSVAARSLASGCGAATRRAGVWRDRCFVAYADSDASSPREEAFRSRLLLRGRVVPDADAAAAYYSEYYLHAQLVDMAQLAAYSAADNVSGARMLGTADATTYAGWNAVSTAHVLAQCARDRTEAECDRCLRDSARAVDWDLDADRHGGVGAAVLGFNCYLAFEVSTVQLPQQQTENWDVVDVLLLIFIGGIAAAIVLCLAYALCASLLATEEKANNKEKMVDAAAAAAPAGAALK